jgi:hypothetical protein
VTEANKRQVGGKHYKNMAIEHWDVVALNDLDYFQGQITKYVMRWKGKNGIQDLEKATHFLQKYIELEKLRKEGKLTQAILASVIAKLEQEDHKQAIANSVVEETPTRVPGVLSIEVEPPARRVCPKCLNPLPAHAIGCPMAAGDLAACELCKGMETHTPTCPAQR